MDIGEKWQRANVILYWEEEMKVLGRRNEAIQH
jgi:hypothetical protein